MLINEVRRAESRICSGEGSITCLHILSAVMCIQFVTEDHIEVQNMKYECPRAFGLYPVFSIHVS